MGTELLLGQILNTNAQHISQRLSALGVDCYYQVTVGDNERRLQQVLGQALQRADVVIASGGLGPTLDDITKEAAAAVTGRPLRLDDAVLARLEQWFRRGKRTMAENNRRQAMVPEGATVLENDHGTAPGLIVPAAAGKAVILLPGPPNELIPMFDGAVVPYLTARASGRPLRLVTRTLRFCEIGESALEERIQDLVAGQQDPTIAPYAKVGEVHLRLATKAADAEEGLARIAPVEAAILERVGEHCYGVDAVSLEAAVGALLAERGLSLAVAESCTGGLLAQRITDVPGASAWFKAGYVTYANSAKVELGVPAAMLAAHGAVSEPVAAAMAEAARSRAGADLAVGISGIAGPGGGLPDKPVGTVCIGWATPKGSGARTFRYWGGRDAVRWRSAQTALCTVRRYLLGRL